MNAQRHSPAAERNRAPILRQLQLWLPARGTALEIASGTGQHAVHFAEGLPGWNWHPSDPDAAARASINAWREAAAISRLLAPLALDVMSWPWPVATSVDAVFNANMLHVAPWASCGALMRGSAQHLTRDGQLILYGPFLIEGVATSAGNLAFDADLRARDPAWGLRKLSAVADEALKAGLTLQARQDMPANNVMLRFARTAAQTL